MWFFSVIGITVFVGVVSGLVWRFVEDRWEKRSQRKKSEIKAPEEIVFDKNNLN